ncbi:unnamed protein product [Hanseniaspora opuntiae]|jgi:D-arabinono-1,4-lactone oxidase|uniref:D-arabinono-1,4-lactone oxidase n=1 Tax=Hanseniaspora opuntiae TaxID=211096 RepID=A0A1E5R5X7_9ASCO
MSTLSGILKTGVNNYTFKNWANIYQIKPELYFQPESIEEIQEIVNECNKNGKTLTVVGSGHSPSDMCLSKDYLLNLDNMSKVLSFKEYEGYADIEVEAGIRIFQLNEYLDQKGYNMQNLGSISEQSAAGIISTGTHGSSSLHSLVSSQYVNLTLINGKGEVVYCDEKENPEIFKAALLSLGKIGIIVKATIRAIPKYNIKSVQEVINFDTLLENWDNIWCSSEFIRCWWYPYNRKCVLWRGSKTEEPVSATPRKSWWGTTIGRFSYEFMLFVAVTVCPRLTPYIEKFVFKNQFGVVETFSKNPEVSASNENEKSALSCVQTSINGLNMDCLFSQFVDEWNCPLSNGPDVLRKLDIAITKAAENNEYYVHVPMEVRCSNTTIPDKHPDYSKRTETSAGPVYGNLVRPYLDPTTTTLQYSDKVTNDQLTLYINATIYRPFGYNTPIRSWFTEFEQILIAGKGKPHWAKNFIGDLSMLPKDQKPKNKYKDFDMYGMASLFKEWFGTRLTKWQNIRTSQDPNNIFLANKEWCERNGLI